MASTYKTPGVYVEEISKFPPSVASVETAIPAFIGYTEKAEKNGDSLLRVPTRITSFLDFTTYFGNAPSREIIVRLNTAYQFVKTELKDSSKPFLLYDSLRLFYDNGGSICYIVSVGDFTGDTAIGDDNSGILSGLRALEKYDEPTLILCPDAVNLDTNLYTFQQQALMQCNKLQDRFLICDLLKNDDKKTFIEQVDQFRDQIGINYLKYGAAYTPWLKTSLPLDLLFRDVLFAYENAPDPINAESSRNLLLSITNDPTIQQLIYDADNSRQVVDTLNINLAPGGTLVETDRKDIRDQVKKLQTDFMSAFAVLANTTIVNFTTPADTMRPIYLKVLQILSSVRSVSNNLSAIQTVEFKLQKDIANLKSQGKSFFNVLATHHKEISTKPGTILLLVADTRLNNVITFLGYSPATLNDVPIDTHTSVQYRLIAAKEAAFDQLKTNADTGTDAASANTAVSTSVPWSSASDLKTAIENELTPAIRAAAPNTAVGGAIELLTARQAAAPLAAKIAVAIAKSIIDQERLNISTLPATVALLIPDFSVFTVPLSNAIHPELVKLKQAAQKAADLVAPGSLKVPVVTAATKVVAIEREYASLAANGAVSVAGNAIAFYESVMNAAQGYETTFNQSLLQSFGTYKTLVAKAGRDIVVLPPGAAIAGVYTSVDLNRGVWKAPANTSLSSVLGPYVALNAQDQESLNVDVNAGKSINVIRTFAGKGTLVWGSRTLAGNDNEWRYVPVRRFFIYAEESIKKATEQFVFEPNDSNTWVRVRAMIENWLTLQWRAGALAGAKPEDAFYVRVGLGQTMTAIDILEGRMNVEIGMAVVRPAEFIILKFSHKMQES